VRLHRSARTCPKSRKLLCERIREEGWTVKEAAEAAGVSVRTVYKWLARYNGEGEAGLLDRSSRPNTTPVQVSHDRVGAIVGLRRLRMTGAQIAGALGMPLSTVGAVLRRVGLGQLRSLEPRSHPTATSVGIRGS